MPGPPRRSHCGRCHQSPAGGSFPHVRRGRRVFRYCLDVLRSSRTRHRPPDPGRPHRLGSSGTGPGPHRDVGGTPGGQITTTLAEAAVLPPPWPWRPTGPAPRDMTAEPMRCPIQARNGAARGTCCHAPDLTKSLTSPCPPYLARATRYPPVMIGRSASPCRTGETWPSATANRIGRLTAHTRQDGSAQAQQSRCVTIAGRVAARSAGMAPVAGDCDGGRDLHGSGVLGRPGREHFQVTGPGRPGRRAGVRGAHRPGEHRRL
jgi:hypothetical protein